MNRIRSLQSSSNEVLLFDMQLSDKNETVQTDDLKPQENLIKFGL